MATVMSFQEREFSLNLLNLNSNHSIQSPEKAHFELYSPNALYKRATEDNELLSVWWRQLQFTPIKKASHF
jgi:hypothetical protein